MLQPFITSEKVRYYVYAAFAALTVLIGATTIGFATAGAPEPVWFDIAQEVFVYIAGAFGFVAASHTGPAQTGYVGEHREDTGLTG